MTRMDFTRDRIQRQSKAASRDATTQERQQQSGSETAQIIKGMGQGRYSPAAGQHMGAEPARKINPNSAEGRAIITRLGLPP